MSLCLRAPNGYLSTKTYQNGLIEESVNLLYDIYGSLALEISFPELCVPAVIQMKRWIKKSKNFFMNKQIQQLIEKVRDSFT
jgi:nucleolar complex protein 2